MNYNVYVKNNRLARIGVSASTVVDLDAGTVTIIRHDKRTYAVLSFREMLGLLKKEAPHGRNMSVVFLETGRAAPITNWSGAAYKATFFVGSQHDSHIVAHADLWNVASLPVAELAEYQNRCFQKFTAEYAPVCSLTEPRGFGILATEAAKLKGYTVSRVMEVRVSVPNITHQPLSPLAVDPDRPLPQAGGEPSSSHQRPPWDIEPGPGLGRIFRAETEISNFRAVPVDDSVFAIPAHYKQVGRPSAY